MTAAVRNSLLAACADTHGDLSTAQAGKLLQAKLLTRSVQHGVYTHRTWRAFYTEWRAFDGDPPGYAARTPSSEPWISEELILKILAKEQGMLDHVRRRGEQWAADQLAEKYGVLPSSRWEANVLARLEQQSRDEEDDGSRTQIGGRARTASPHKTTRHSFWEVVYPDDEPHNIFTAHEREVVDVNAPRPKRARRAPAHVTENREAREKLRAEMKREQAASQGAKALAKGSVKARSKTRRERDMGDSSTSYSLASSHGPESLVRLSAQRSRPTATKIRRATTEPDQWAATTSPAGLQSADLTPEQMAAVFAYGAHACVGNYGMDEIRYARSLARQWGGSESFWYSQYDLWYNHEKPFDVLDEHLRSGWCGRAVTPPPPPFRSG